MTTTHTPAPVVITHHQTTGAGGVQYTVKGVGTITLAPSPSDYWSDTSPRDTSTSADQPTRPTGHLIAYWAAHDPTNAYPDGNWADPARVNRIPLHGYASFAIADALDSLTDPGHGWVRPHRHTGHRYGGADISDAARRRIAWILANLTADYLARPDHDDLAHAHDLAHVSERAREHARRIHELDLQIAELTAERDTQACHHATQQALITTTQTAA